MGQSLDIPRVIKDNWKRLDLIVNKIKMKLGRNASVTHKDITLEDLLTDTIIIKDSGGNIIFYVDVNELYFVAAAPIADGMPIGLLLSLTYKT